MQDLHSHSLTTTNGNQSRQLHFKFFGRHFPLFALSRYKLWLKMNKGGSVGGTGPTAAAAASAAQKQKALLQRVETDVSSLVDNFANLVNASRVNELPVKNHQEALTMEVRAARMVQAGESLLKLVSELKQTAIFSGFASLNDHVEQRIGEFNKLTEKTETTLARVAEEAAASLKDLETHFYSSEEKAG